MQYKMGAAYLYRVDTPLQKYFIAIVPPQPIVDQVNALKLYCREHYNTKGALQSPPHITLHMPFLWKEKNEESLKNSLKAFCERESNFEVELQNFSAFAPKVIFVKVEENRHLLSLQQQLTRFCRVNLNLLNANYKELPFHPHVTIAFRDLKKPAFAKAWEEFKDKEFYARFIVNSIALLKHDGHQWHVYDTFQFGAVSEKAQAIDV